jgi:hypothetical protein
MMISSFSLQKMIQAIWNLKHLTTTFKRLISVLELVLSMI